MKRTFRTYLEDLIKGMGFFGIFLTPKYYRFLKLNESKALSQDWIVVGNDMHKVISKMSKENKSE